MKLAMRITARTSMIAAALVVVGACSQGVKLDDKAPVVDNTGTPATGADPNAVTRVETSTANLDAIANELSKRSVYFDYDSYIVKDEFRSAVEANGKYLNSNRGRKVIVQGNTDERGGSEYNLALGQKRAEAVRKQLALTGVPESQIEAVSLGKEKPRSTGHDEAAWAENRRADFLYQ